MSSSNAKVRLSRPELILLALPFIFFLYPAIALLATKSTIPIYLHRYSWNLLLFNVLNIAIYVTFVMGYTTRRLGVQFFAILFLAALSFVILSNNSLSWSTSD